MFRFISLHIKESFVKRNGIFHIVHLHIDIFQFKEPDKATDRMLSYMHFLFLWVCRFLKSPLFFYGILGI